MHFSHLKLKLKLKLQLKAANKQKELETKRESRVQRLASGQQNQTLATKT